MKKNKFLVIMLSLGVICVLSMTSTAIATPYYKGKTITIIIPHGPGGGADRVSRMLARHLPKHIPGKPKIMLRYMLGGMSLVASNWFYNSAPKDGTALLTGSGPVGLNSLLNIEGVKYDTDNMPVILACPMGVVVCTHTEKVSNREEFFKKSKDLVFGCNPMPWTNTIHFELVKKLFNFEMKKDVLAYDTGAGNRALLGKEIDVGVQGIANYNATFHPLVKKGEILPLWQSGIMGPDGKLTRLLDTLADVPTVGELYEQIHGKAPSGEVWDALNFYIAYVRTFNKPIFLPPGTEKYEPILTKAVESMRKDPAFQKEANKVLVGAPTFSGADAKRIRGQLAKEGQQIKQWIRNWLKTEYGVKTQ